MPFIGGAFEMYRNFDGKEATFGDISVRAVSGNAAKCSIYASLDSRVDGRMVLVLINKTQHPLQGRISLHNADDYTHAEIYQLTSGKPDPKYAGAQAIGVSHELQYTMPPFSVSTLRLSEAPEGP
jgi:mannan endo-1,4-beta-mannosidase